MRWRTRQWLCSVLYAGHCDDLLNMPVHDSSRPNNINDSSPACSQYLSECTANHASIKRHSHYAMSGISIPIRTDRVNASPRSVESSLLSGDVSSMNMNNNNIIIMTQITVQRGSAEHRCMVCKHSNFHNIDGNRHDVISGLQKSRITKASSICKPRCSANGC